MSFGYERLSDVAERMRANVHVLTGRMTFNLLLPSRGRKRQQHVRRKNEDGSKNIEHQRQPGGQLRKRVAVPSGCKNSEAEVFEVGCAFLIVKTAPYHEDEVNYQDSEGPVEVEPDGFIPLWTPALFEAFQTWPKTMLREQSTLHFLINSGYSPVTIKQRRLDGLHSWRQCRLWRGYGLQRAALLLKSTEKNIKTFTTREDGNRRRMDLSLRNRQQKKGTGDKRSCPPLGQI